MKLYAVANGRKTGIFDNWEDCEKQVKGFSGAKFKSFKNKQDALTFITLNLPSSTDKKDFNALDESDASSHESSNKRKRNNDDDNDDECVIKKKKNDDDENYHRIYEDGDYYYEIYTDGACGNNGGKDARAGIGVYFPYDKKKNISKRISGRQTNNRAEVIAVIEALKCADEDKNIIVCSDSQYFINCESEKWGIHTNEELLNEIWSLKKKRTGKTKFKKVKGHSRKKDGNHFADQLAKKSLLE